MIPVSTTAKNQQPNKFERKKHNIGKVWEKFLKVKRKKSPLPFTKSQSPPEFSLQRPSVSKTAVFEACWE